MDMEKKHLNTKSLNHPSKNGHKAVTTEEESFRNSLFFGLFDHPDSRTRQNGSVKKQYSHMGDNYHRIYEEDVEEQRMDTRVLMLLEYFRELYVREINVLKNVFPGVKDDFLHFFKTIRESMTSQVKKSRERMEFHTIQRSLSVGSRGIDLGSEIPIGNERFKVSTVNAGNVPGGGAAGKGQTKK